MSNTAIIRLSERDIDWTSVEVDGVDTRDYPDFCDAYFSYACYEDGTELTDSELDDLTSDYEDTLYDMAVDKALRIGVGYADDIER